MCTSHRIGLFIILALLVSNCQTAPSTGRDQPQPSADQPINAPTILGAALSPSSTPAALVLQTTTLVHTPATAQPTAAGAAPPTAPAVLGRNRMTPATLADLQLIHEVALPFAVEAAIAPDSHRLAVATPEMVVLFELPSLQQVNAIARSLPRRAEPIRLAFHPDGTAVALRETVFGEGEGDSVTIWPITTTNSTGGARHMSLLVDHQFTRAAFSPTGALAWQDPATGHIILQQSAGVTLTVTNIHDTPDLIDRSIDPDKGGLLRSTNVSALEFSADGSLLCLGSRTGKVLLFQTTDGARIGSLEVIGTAPGAFIEGLMFSADNTLVGAQLTDRLIVWQIGTQKPVLELTMNLPRPERTPAHDVVTFSPDNQLLITANAAGVTFYRLETGEVLRTLPLASQGMALSPDGQFLAIVHDGKVGLWGIEPASR